MRRILICLFMVLAPASLAFAAASTVSTPKLSAPKLISPGAAGSVSVPATGKNAAHKNADGEDANGKDGGAPKTVEVTADQSLEWYQDKHMYVARGNAKAVRGEMVVEADLLTAHERDKPAAGAAKPATKTADKDGDKNSDKSADKNGDNSSGDIDKMTAEGNVRITDPKQRVTGGHAVYDLDQHMMEVTGGNLKYETEKETVTAKDSLEYYEDKKIAVARGHAVGIRQDRHIEGNVLTAEFRDTPAGQNELWKMTADGHVTVITKSDVSRGDHMVFDAARNIAVLRDNVKITRADGTQLSGDVGEVDFTNNKSRLMNNGHGRVRALLAAKSGPQAGGKPDTNARTASAAGDSP